jgi:hypothetical protein
MNAGFWPYVLAIHLTLAGSLRAQGADEIDARIAPAGSRISIPLELLRPAGDSLALMLTWSAPGARTVNGQMGLVASLPRLGTGTVGRAYTFRIEPAGSIDAIVLLGDTAMNAGKEDSVMIVQLGPSSALNTLLEWRPDSIYVETPPWGDQIGYRAWIRPKYEP